MLVQNPTPPIPKYAIPSLYLSPYSLSLLLHWTPPFLLLPLLFFTHSPQLSHLTLPIFRLSTLLLPLTFASATVAFFTNPFSFSHLTSTNIFHHRLTFFNFQHLLLATTTHPKLLSSSSNLPLAPSIVSVVLFTNLPY